ncbi:MAG: haloacid dehalogenase-like hydrolase [Pirellulales bacterium]
MWVFLFDIDGTLLSTGGAGMAALRAAMQEEFGVAEPQEVPVSGRTDRGIARQLFAAHAMDDTEEHWQRFRNAYLRHLQQQLPQRVGRVLPGVESLLAALASVDHARLGLLTGNVRAGADLKLGHYGLASYFAFGGFGDRHADRNAVAAEALTASRQHVTFPVESARVWVIGDTPLDVACARSIGARSVAVATGTFSRGELAPSEPDLLLDDLSDTAYLRQALLS